MRELFAASLNCRRDRWGSLRATRNKRVVVSGCFSGMGEATARLLTVGRGSPRPRLQRDAAQAGFVHADVTCATRLRSMRRLRSLAARSMRSSIAPDCRRLRRPRRNESQLCRDATVDRTSPAVDAAGGAIVSISSNGGLGWSRRVPVLMGCSRSNVRWRRQMVPGQSRSCPRGICLLQGSAHRLDDDDVDALIKRGIRINCTMPGPHKRR